jgi:hypothetical protein
VVPFVLFVVPFVPFVVPFVPFVVPFVPFVPFVQFVQFSTAGFFYILNWSLFDRILFYCFQSPPLKLCHTFKGLCLGRTKLENASAACSFAK